MLGMGKLTRAQCGRLGGYARRRVLTAERRREIARGAAVARWAKRDAETTENVGKSLQNP
jgi:hypothetical protein